MAYSCDFLAGLSFEAPMRSPPSAIVSPSSGTEKLCDPCNKVLRSAWIWRRSTSGVRLTFLTSRSQPTAKKTTSSAIRVTMPKPRFVMLSHIVQFSPAIRGNLLADPEPAFLQMHLAGHYVDSTGFNNFCALSAVVCRDFPHEV